jgi:hypothetical protein
MVKSLQIRENIVANSANPQLEGDTNSRPADWRLGRASCVAGGMSPRIWRINAWARARYRRARVGEGRRIVRSVQLIGPNNDAGSHHSARGTKFIVERYIQIEMTRILYRVWGAFPCSSIRTWRLRAPRWVLFCWVRRRLGKSRRRRPRLNLGTLRRFRQWSSTLQPCRLSPHPP